MIIKYGTENLKIDVTNICYNTLCANNIIRIPKCDVLRSYIFGDPLYGVVKTIFVTNNLGETTQYYNTQIIYINTLTDVITVINEHEPDLTDESHNAIHFETFFNKLTNIQKSLKIHFGSFHEEYPEQLMVATYLTGNEKVLEIGGNIGRNSLIIASILKEKNNNNFITLETCREYALQLTYNRDVNNLNFHIEQSALSKRKLIQKGWNTIVSDTVLDEYTPVNTITLDELYLKYNIDFDTLILDCEGAFYYILLDMPEILKNVKLIIMENDYYDINHKTYVDKMLYSNGFRVKYSKLGGWGCCYNNFYEVWNKEL